MKKKYASNSLIVLISSPDSSAWNFIEDVCVGPTDHILALTEVDFHQPDQVIEGAQICRLTIDGELVCGSTARPRIVKGRSHFQRALDTMLIEPLTEFAVLGCGSSSLLLNIVLNQAKERFGTETSTTIAQFDVDSDAFALITETSSDVSFDNCRFGEGWWLQPTTSKSCEHLQFTNCSGPIPEEIELGQAAWEKLTSLWIDENVEAKHLYPRADLKCNFGTPHVESSSELTPYLVKAFWNPNLDSLRLNHCKSAAWIVDFPPKDSLTTLDWNNTPVSNLEFGWICAHRRIKDLTLAWEKGVRLDWRSLSKLKYLRSLDVSATHFDDIDLETLAGSVKLRTLSAYYTSITPACWKFVLRWTSLRGFWASTEAMNGEVTGDLPETTTLREVVAMNARLEPFERLLARYPNVELVQM
jgi:hypothetical protein